MDTELKKRLEAIPEEAPDELDRRMIIEAARVNDGSAVPLREYQRTLEEYSGKVNLRIPRSLHKELAEHARQEGVSLNQYMVYKLSR